MARKWKILIGVIGVLVVMLTVNTLIVEGETKPAEVTVPGGRILHLEIGDLQVFERGPRNGTPIVLIHCYTCSIAWWEGMIPVLDRSHRVIAMTCGGSAAPKSRSPDTRWRARAFWPKPLTAARPPRDGRRPLAGRDRGHRPRRNPAAISSSAS